MSTSKYLSCNNVNDGVYVHGILIYISKTDDRLVNKRQKFFFSILYFEELFMHTLMRKISFLLLIELK